MLTAQEWSNHLERTLEVLKSQGSIRARAAAQEIANQFSADSYLDVRAVVQAAQALQPIGPRPVGPGIAVSPDPNDRDEHFNQAMSAFIKEFRVALDQRTIFERDVAANADLGRGECRKCVHEYLGTQRDQVFSKNIVVATLLSDEQVFDALDQLEHEGLLSNDSIKSDVGEVWRVRLNPTGRNLLDGTMPARPRLFFNNVTIINSNLNHSPVGVSGNGDVTINVEIPPIPPELRAAIDADSTASLQLRALDEEIHKPAPCPAIVAQLLGALRTTIEALNLSSEIAAHGHEWLTIVQAWIAQLPH